MEVVETGMKRKREMEGKSEIRSAIEELSMLAKSESATVGDTNLDAAPIPTKHFLHLCTLILQVLGQFFSTCYLSSNVRFSRCLLNLLFLFFVLQTR